MTDMCENCGEELFDRSEGMGEGMDETGQVLCLACDKIEGDKTGCYIYQHNKDVRFSQNEVRPR